MLLLRLIVLGSACWALAGCAALGDHVGALSSTDAFVKRQLDQRGL